MPTDLNTLIELAGQATPGPWFQAYARVCSKPLSDEYMRIEATWGDEDMADDDPRWSDLPEPDICHFAAAHGDTLSGQPLTDALFIAAASPSTILELGKRVRELEAGLREACDIAARVITDTQVLPSTDSDRIAELRKLADQQ